MSIANPQSIRPSAVAGTFYPADPSALRSFVASSLAQFQPSQIAPRAIISPHAGFRFSGLLTARAMVAGKNHEYKRIVVLSPSHRVAFSGIALPSAQSFAIPGGTLAVDTEAYASLISHGLAITRDAAHAQEHGIEVQLPFIHTLFDQTPIVPLVLGDVPILEVAKAIDHLATKLDGESLFILSSDLSHYLPADKAIERDRSTAIHIETAQIAQLRGQDACGVRAICGYLASAHGRGARIMRLGMANSSQITHDASRTVGYGAWALFEKDREIFPKELRAGLLRAARQSLGSRLRKGKTPDINLGSFAWPLRTTGAAFVSLSQNNRLRGCIGSLVPHRPLIEDVVINAAKAGFEDPRFRPLRDNELKKTHIKIAILSRSTPMTFTSQADVEAQLTPGRDGLTLHQGHHRGTFLPMVWEQLPTARQFLEGLKVKAGLPKDFWSDDIQIERYSAETFAEPQNR